VGKEEGMGRRGEKVRKGRKADPSFRGGKRMEGTRDAGRGKGKGKGRILDTPGLEEVCALASASLFSLLGYLYPE
jgi:hypothetical protein